MTQGAIKAKRRVLFVAPYPHGTAACQRFRYEQYESHLRAGGWEVDHASFWSPAAWAILYRKGSRLKKLIYMIAALGRRLFLLSRVRSCTVVFVHREATPLGPPWFEWCTAKLLRVPLVYDFDDAIWLPNVSSANPSAGRMRSYGKVARICRMARRVSCGNQFLADFAGAVSTDVVINPTVVDTDTHHNQLRGHLDGARVVGWTGTHSTISHLQEIIPALQQLQQRVDFELCVIADCSPDLELANVRFVQWRKESEVDDLLRFDVGIMPLPDTEWARGKCGFKLLQYMALGIPAAASPVGVNRDIVDHGRNGYLCSSTDEWIEALETMLGDSALRTRLGVAARGTIENRYSAAANRGAFAATLDLG